MLCVCRSACSSVPVSWARHFRRLLPSAAVHLYEARLLAKQNRFSRRLVTSDSDIEAILRDLKGMTAKVQSQQRKEACPPVAPVSSKLQTQGDFRDDDLKKHSQDPKKEGLETSRAAANPPTPSRRASPTDERDVGQALQDILKLEEDVKLADEALVQEKLKYAEAVAAAQRRAVPSPQPSLSLSLTESPLDQASTPTEPQVGALTPKIAVTIGHVAQATIVGVVSSINMMEDTELNEPFARLIVHVDVPLRPTATPPNPPMERAPGSVGESDAKPARTLRNEFEVRCYGAVLAKFCWTQLRVNDLVHVFGSLYNNAVLVPPANSEATTTTSASSSPRNIIVVQEHGGVISIVYSQNAKNEPIAAAPPKKEVAAGK